MSDDGSATYMVRLMVANERGLYHPVRAIVMEHGNDPGVAAPYVQRFVTAALRGDNKALTAGERATWKEDIHRRGGGLTNVDWTEVASAGGNSRRKTLTRGGLRSAARRR